jgi:integrase
MPKEQNLYKRGKTWWVKIERQGNKIHESTGETTVKAAREYRDRALNKLKRLRNGLRDDKTYDKTMEEFLAHCDVVLKPKSVKRYETSAFAMESYFTGKNLGDITKGDIANYLSDRKREVSGCSVNRDRSCLSAMFSFAVDRDYVQFNPVLNVKKMKESEPHTRNLSVDEFKAIHEKCDRLLADMVEFDVETGLRASELVYLTWRQVDLAAHQITLNDTKSGRSRIVPLSVRAAAILASQIRNTATPLVFWHADGKPYKHMNRAFAKAAKAANINDVTFHDLRRTFTCWHFSKGVPLPVLQKLLGHSTYAVTEASYAFLQQDDLHQAIRGVTNSSQAQRTSSVNLSLPTKKGKDK